MRYFHLFFPLLKKEPTLRERPRLEIPLPPLPPLPPPRDQDNFEKSGNRFIIIDMIDPDDDNNTIVT